jgi:hypothetical protein
MKEEYLGLLVKEQAESRSRRGQRSHHRVIPSHSVRGSTAPAIERRSGSALDERRSSGHGLAEITATDTVARRQTDHRSYSYSCSYSHPPSADEGGRE